MSWNPYPYALGNPVNYTDPSGEFPWLEATALGLVVAAVVGLVTAIYAGALYVANQLEMQECIQPGDLFGDMFEGFVIGSGLIIIPSAIFTGLLLAPIPTLGALAVGAESIFSQTDKAISKGYADTFLDALYYVNWFQVAVDSGIGFVAGLTLGSSGRAMLGAIVGLAGYTGGIVIYNHFADKDLTFSLKDASLSMIISGLTSWLDKWVVPNTMLGRFTSGTTAATVYHVLTDDNKFGSVAESSLLIAGGASNWILNFLPPWASDLVGGVVNAMLSATSSALDE